MGINLFPQLTEEQKRNTYKLPLTANQVKANKEIEYSHWDAESQCAEDISKDQIHALQKQFQPKSTANASNIELPKVDEETKDALVKQLVEALLQYILQILK